MLKQQIPGPSSVSALREALAAAKQAQEALGRAIQAADEAEEAPAPLPQKRQRVQQDGLTARLIA